MVSSDCRLEKRLFILSGGGVATLLGFLVLLFLFHLMFHFFLFVLDDVDFVYYVCAQFSVYGIYIIQSLIPRNSLLIIGGDRIIDLFK